MDNIDRIYLDYAASTPMDPRVVEEMSAVLRDIFGNASSIHRYGLSAKSILDNARVSTAKMLNAEPDEIYFTSGGTESNNLVLQGVAQKFDEPGHIITSAIEHPSVIQTGKYLQSKGWQITFLPVTESGVVEVESVKEAITPATRLISIMHVNNEIGSINPIAAIAEIAAEQGIAFHSDVVQSFGKLPLDMKKLPVSFLSIAGHKIYGPKGAGALFIRRKSKISKILHGGSQENKMRSGTENIPAIAGFKKAVDILCTELPVDYTHLTEVGSYLRECMHEKVPQAKCNSPEDGLCSIQNYSLPGFDNMSLLMGLDLAGIAVSNGSACSLGHVTTSHVLNALRLPDNCLRSALRISLGRFTSREHIIRATDTLRSLIKK